MNKKARKPLLWIVIILFLTLFISFALSFALLARMWVLGNYYGSKYLLVIYILITAVVGFLAIYLGNYILLILQRKKFL